MGFINWLCGFQSEAEAEGKRVVSGLKRLGDILHGAADRLEGQSAIESHPALEINEIKRKTTRNSR